MFFLYILGHFLGLCKFIEYFDVVPANAAFEKLLHFDYYFSKIYMKEIIFFAFMMIIAIFYSVTL